MIVAVTNYSNVVDAGSDSDDEDKLHIVEEDGGGVADGTECDSMLPEDEHGGGYRWDGGKIIFTLKHADAPHTSS